MYNYNLIYIIVGVKRYMYTCINIKLIIHTLIARTSVESRGLRNNLIADQVGPV